MKHHTYHEINDSEYLGIVTIIDYRVSVKKYLMNKKFKYKGKSSKILVDLAMKIGLSPYRFVEFQMSEFNTIIPDTGDYSNPTEEVVKLANGYVRELKDFFPGSLLASNHQEMILNDK